MISRSLKIVSFFLCLFLLVNGIQGCDSDTSTGVSHETDGQDEEIVRASELPREALDGAPIDMDNIPIEADMPRYRENFKISNPKRSTITGNIETTVSSDCARMIPVTVRLVDFEVVNKTPRWHFQVENTGSTPWEGILRIYLLSHGRPVDHMDLPISSPMDVGQGVRDYMNSSHAPMVMQGDVDQYGWTYLTTALHTRPESALSRP